MKNKKFMSIGIVVAVIAVIGIWLGGTYNSLVGVRNDVDAQWATVDSKLQRRADLIPNLVSAVKGSMKHETEVFNDIAEARKAVAGASNTKEASTANDQLTKSVDKLMTVIVENYPTLTSNENVKTLMTQLEGSENRISVERDRYNKDVKQYNSRIQKFPTKIIASLFGFDTKDYFEADESSRVVPTVDLEN